MSTPISRLLAAALELHGINSPAELARALGTSSQVVHNWTSRGISAKGLLSIEAALGIRADYITRGELPMQFSDRDTVKLADAGSVSVPLLSVDQVSGWLNGGPRPRCEPLMTDQNLSRRAFALELLDNSMAPAYDQGDRCIFDPELTPRPGDCVVARTATAGAVVRRYRPLPTQADGSQPFELVAINTDHPTLRSDLDKAELLGVMVEHRRYRKA